MSARATRVSTREKPPSPLSPLSGTLTPPAPLSRPRESQLGGEGLETGPWAAAGDVGEAFQEFTVRILDNS